MLAGEDGTTVPMAKIVAAGHEGQRARLYAMTLGVDELAQRRGLTAIFVTVTLPAAWHPSPAVGRRTWTPDRSPNMADAALRRTWARFRARLAAGGVPTLGLRVWEPHQDGCPHLHALLYVEPGQVAEVDAELQAVCPEPRPGERIASKLVIVDRARASPATYVAKYILKACSGTPAAADCEGGGDDDQLAHYERHRATASERQWRRFGWLGVHGVQRVWQRLLTTEELPEHAPDRVRAVWMALRGGRWADALEALGAIGPRGQGVGLAYETEIEHVDQETGEVTREPLTNRYGDPARRPAWITDLESGWQMPLARQKWTIERVDDQKSLDFNTFTVVQSCPRVVQGPGLRPVLWPPRTRVPTILRS